MPGEWSSVRCWQWSARGFIVHGHIPLAIPSAKPYHRPRRRLVMSPHPGQFLRSRLVPLDYSAIAWPLTNSHLQKEDVLTAHKDNSL